MDQQSKQPEGSWHQQNGGNYPALRSPKGQEFKFSVNAKEFVPKSSSQLQQLPIHQPTAHFQPQMAMSQPSQIHQRFANAQGVVEPGGGDSGGEYDYSSIDQHHYANGTDSGKVSALQNRLSNMQIGGSDDGGHNNGKDFKHHQHHQQSMQQHHHHRGQQQHQGGHHGYHHHHHHQQQQHVPYSQQGQFQYMMAPYVMNKTNQHDHRKYNNGGQQQHRSWHQHQQQQHHHHHHQQQQHGSYHHHSMAGGAHSMPSMYGGSSGSNAAGGRGYNVYDQVTTEPNENQTYALDYLTEVTAELFDNPGMFEDEQQKLSKLFVNYIDDTFVLYSAIEMIFEQSIKESNFRYMGARLLHLLDDLNKDPMSPMRQLLQNKIMLQANELPEFMKQEQVKVRGATLFLAEMYMQLQNPQQVAEINMADFIIRAIKLLLQKEGPENVKCVCLCLKLSGFKLEMEQDYRENVNCILQDLEQLVLKEALPNDTVKIIQSVLDLREKSWGRSSEEIASMASISHVPLGLESNDSPVIYGPDGEVLTEEESSFVENGLAGDKRHTAYNGYEDEDDAYGLIDPDEDLEVQLAFRDFLESSNRPQQQH